MSRATAVMLIGAAVMLAGCPRSHPGSGGGGAATIGHTEHFTLSLEQGGRAVPIVNNQARLRKEPFAIILTFPRLDGVMVNASLRPDLLLAVRAGQPIDNVLPLPAKGLSEDLRNPRQQLFINDSQYTYWYCFGPETHTFDEMSQDGDRYICRRTIAT